jgi:hypothetical protein
VVKTVEVEDEGKVLNCTMVVGYHLDEDSSWGSVFLVVGNTLLALLDPASLPLNRIHDRILPDIPHDPPPIPRSRQPPPCLPPPPPP